jgi:1,4-dihydroxy-2-naphthoate octaprenyltransferase
VFITWGPLMVGGVYFAATGRVPGLVWVASLPYALLCTAVLLGKHIDKIAYDQPLGIRTVPVLLGRRRALDLTTVVIGLFYMSVILDVAVGALSWPALFALGGLWWARPTWKALAAPPPDQPPPGFPVWPLWYGAWAFVHTRNAGSLLLLGVIISTAVHVKPF